MKAWMTYINERFPLGTYIFLTAGFAVSAWLFSSEPLNSLAFTFTVVGLLLFFFELRLMDELKDYNKDLLAHPERPLPRGLISVAAVRGTIRLGLFAMVLLSIAAGFFTTQAAGALFAMTTLYLYLMYREFFLGDWLEKRMFLYGLSHQVILLLLTSFSFAALSNKLWREPVSLYYGFLVLGSFFTYEIARKLDPEAHPALNTYRQQYQPSVVFLFSLVLLLISFIAAEFLDSRFGLLMMCLNVGILVAIRNSLFGKGSHKAAELWATLGLTLAIWSGAIIYLVGLL